MNHDPFVAGILAKQGAQLALASGWSIRGEDSGSASCCICTTPCAPYFLFEDKAYCGYDARKLGAFEAVPAEPAYPEHDKLRVVADKSQVCYDFLEWLEEQKIVLAKYDEASGQELYPDYTGRKELLAKFFEIDLKKLDAEKDRMLEVQRAANARNQTESAG